jgi:hypothetical protein
VASFCQIILIDTDGVYPQVLQLLLLHGEDLLKGVFTVPSYCHRLSIDIDINSRIRVTPGVGNSTVWRSGIEWPCRHFTDDMFSEVAFQNLE